MTLHISNTAECLFSVISIQVMQKNLDSQVQLLYQGSAATT